MVHSDVCGPMSIATPGGKCYMVTFMGDFSRSCAVYFMALKSETLSKFKEFITNNGGEYTSREFKTFLRDNLIEHETTTPHTPEQNGVAKRMNGTLLEKTKAMIFHAGLPESYWGEAINTVANLSNRLPTQVLDRNASPYELWYPKSLSFWLPWLCACTGNTACETGPEGRAALLHRAWQGLQRVQNDGLAHPESDTQKRCCV